MLGTRFARALAVGAFMLASIALVLFLASVFSGGARHMTTSGLGGCALGMKGGCAGNGAFFSGRSGMMAQPEIGMMEDVTMSAPATDGMMAPAPMMKTTPVMDGSVVSAMRKVATTATLDLRAKSLDWTTSKIREIAKDTGGFVENANVSQPERGIRTAWMTVKVPADRFEAALTEIKQTADQVVNENMGSTDMTAQDIDLAARLKNKRAEEAAYENLLSSAAKVSDVIEVTRQLTQVRTEIESLEQQARYLEGQTVLSTISVSLTEDPQVEAKPGEFSRGNVFKAALTSLVDALLALGSGLVYFIISGLPILLIVLGVLWIVYRLAKRGVDHLFGR